MIDVAVLAGGCSPEHEVSLASARRALGHLDRGRYRVWPVLLDRDGAWWLPPRPLARLDEMGDGFRVEGMEPRRPGAALDRLLDLGLDVVLPILHGPFGEDGTVQGMLELHGVPFVGSGCAASAVAMDKVRTRECFLAHDVPMPHALSAAVPAPGDRAAVDNRTRAVIAAVGLPCFLKTDRSGSTLGVVKARSKADVAAFLAAPPAAARRFVAEEAVVGEEITVGVLGNTGTALEALPAIGIYPQQDGFFTHEAKYEPGRTDEVIPPRGVSEAGLAQAAELALRCHEALQCDGMSRTDMIVRGDGRIVVLETNTIPGMTDTSLLPQAAAAAGRDYPALLDRLIDLGLEAARRGRPTAGVAARG